MISRDQVEPLVFSVMDDLNEDMAPDQQLEKRSDTVLFGQGGKLDSLGLVSLIVALEQKVNERFSTSITLANEQALAMAESPFRNVQTLTDYVVELASA